jgi:hypothetical protein
MLRRGECVVEQAVRAVSLHYTGRYPAICVLRHRYHLYSGAHGVWYVTIRMAKTRAEHRKEIETQEVEHGTRRAQ